MKAIAGLLVGAFVLGGCATGPEMTVRLAPLNSFQEITYARRDPVTVSLAKSAAVFRLYSHGGAPGMPIEAGVTVVNPGTTDIQAAPGGIKASMRGEALRVEVVSRDEAPVLAPGASYDAVVFVEVPGVIDRTSRVLIDVPAGSDVHRFAVDLAPSPPVNYSNPFMAIRRQSLP